MHNFFLKSTLIHKKVKNHQVLIFWNIFIDNDIFKLCNNQIFNFEISHSRV